MNPGPIGIFDSGIGGTSIWREIQELLPYEDFIYIADSKNAPYGEKSKEQIKALSIKNTEYLIDRRCKLIVVACNTATTNAIEYLRKAYDIPFIGIEPAIKPAALNSRTRTIGILATKGTLSSSLFHSTSTVHAAGITIVEQIGSGIVELIENGKLDSVELRTLLKGYLEPMLKNGIDYLVLGCTHYPYLIPILQDLLPANVQIIDSGEAVAKQTKAVLQKLDLQSTSKIAGKHQFLTTGSVSILANFVSAISLSANVSYLTFE